MACSSGKLCAEKFAFCCLLGCTCWTTQESSLSCCLTKFLLWCRGRLLMDGFVASFCFLEIINCNDEGSGRGNKVFLNGVFLWEAKMKKCWAAFPLCCYPALLSVLHCCSGQGCPHWVPALPAGTWGWVSIPLDEREGKKMAAGSTHPSVLLRGRGFNKCSIKKSARRWDSLCG